MKVTKGYRDSGGTLQSGGVVSTTAYDGLNRRTVKAVRNSADLDCTYHDYYTASWQLTPRPQATAARPSGIKFPISQWIELVDRVCCSE